MTDEKAAGRMASGDEEAEEQNGIAVLAIVKTGSLYAISAANVA
jgi:hypothetical protein